LETVAAPRTRPAVATSAEQGEAMPYHALDELPPSVRKLPRHAQEIFRAAFNSAWHTYAGPTASEQEETALRVAWAAVKKRYRKIGEVWSER
jgi:cation transport regulator